jgi:hypothetical protein
MLGGGHGGLVDHLLLGWAEQQVVEAVGDPLPRAAGQDARRRVVAFFDRHLES